MLKADFYKSLKVNTMSDVERLQGNLETNLSKDSFELVTPFTIDTDYPYEALITIKRNVVNTKLLNGFGDEMDTTTIDWNKSYTPNMVTLTIDKALRDLGLKEWTYKKDGHKLMIKFENEMLPLYQKAQQLVLDYINKGYVISGRSCIYSDMYSFTSLIAPNRKDVIIVGITHPEKYTYDDILKNMDVKQSVIVELQRTGKDDELLECIDYYTLGGKTYDLEHAIDVATHAELVRKQRQTYKYDYMSNEKTYTINGLNREGFKTGKNVVKIYDRRLAGIIVKFVEVKNQRTGKKAEMLFRSFLSNQN